MGRLVLSGALLGVLASVLDPVEVAVRLRGLHPGWVAAALALSVVQVVLSAWRWRFTARRLGLRLPLGAAVAEYYLATFLNQLLPGGVVGDVSRAWRHAREASALSEVAPPGPGGTVRGRAVHAVVVERASGQLVMLAAAGVSAVVLLVPQAGGPTIAGALGVAASVPWAVGRMLRRRARSATPGGVLHSLDRALLAPGALAVQLPTSVAVVASYVATYLMAARALGVTSPLAELAPLVPPVLVTMLLPVTVAGWGLREAAAAALWTSVGLTASDGVAISVTYGLLVLLGSAPGLAVLAFRRRRRRTPGRTPGPSPDGYAGPAAAAPRPASPPAGG